jgi:hypothetical protein
MALSLSDLGTSGAPNYQLQQILSQSFMKMQAMAGTSVRAKDKLKSAKA